MTRLCAAALVLLACVVLARPALAIPAFARRYQTACSTCHVQFPKLNNFGEAFRRNGYRFPSDELAQWKQRPLTLVAPERRELFPRSDWPTDLPDFPPIAMIVRGVVPFYPDEATRPEGEEVVTFERVFSGAALVAGARFGEDVAFFGGLSLSPRDGVSFGRAFVTVSNLLGGPSMHLRVGQFEPQVVSFSSYRRIGGPFYRILNDAMKPGGWALDPYMRGLGLSGTFGGRAGYDVGYGQGVVSAAFGDAPRQAPRDGYAHVFTKMGGLRLDGVEEADTASVERSVTIGAFVYGGVHTVDLRKSADDEAAPEDDDLVKAGGDVDARVGPLELLVAASIERHAFASRPTVMRAQGLAEASYAVFPWLVGLVRWEVEAGEGTARKRLVPLVSVHPRLNLKTFVYAQIEQDSAKGAAYHVNEIDLGAAYAF